MNNNPMTQERLDAIQERVDDMWETDANFVAAYAREDVPALLAEVARLRALTTVDKGMLARAQREYEWSGNIRRVLEAALGTGEEA